jgi:hypothetical protein
VEEGRSGRSSRLNAEFLVEEALKGNHLLFSNEIISEAFLRNVGALHNLFESRRDEINEIVRTLLSQPSLDQGRNYILSLPRDDQHILILLYFQLVENVLLRRKPTLH